MEMLEKRKSWRMIWKGENVKGEEAYRKERKKKIAYEKER